MWVRSQNKITLVKCDYFVVLDKRIDAIHNGFSQTPLGTYSTHEKTLKVLDMIQKYILIEKTDVVIFQMPLDSEVQDND